MNECPNNVSSSLSLHSWQSGRGHHEASLRADVTRPTSFRHFSRLAESLAHSCKGPPTADIIWSVHRMGDLSRTLVPSTLPCTTRRSMESLSRRETCPKNFKMRLCTNAERRFLMPISWSIEMLVRNSVHDTPSIRLQHHISSASIFFSTSRKVHVSAAYKNMGKTSV
ncbi:jg26922 [Pararge aegeria aegeria]|uniref:Jg26922 protein n=1 Tax=Pararge aegeria aegeria TaxID=348720 RepID=A0A8S4QDC9_9NEOP|nr:jg26922 [Pararge aegeria aegeria]